MAIRIDQINVETVGPISELQLSLGPLNLIYGRNEQGKTFLVEFVIRCLFNNLSGWRLRQADSRGKIVVSGLTEKPLSLMPSSRRKLEDYLAESEPGMPAKISRLLVVKGADPNFEYTQRSGISKDVLKHFLSGQGVLDEIQKAISKTVQGAEVENGEISGHRRGELSTRIDRADELKSLDHLFEDIERIYSGGERQALASKVHELEDVIAAQEIARRHQAYQTHLKIQEQEKRLERLPQDELKQLNDDFAQLRETQKRIKRQEARLAELAQKSKHYPWLEEAVSLYERRGVQGQVGITPIYPAAIIIALLLAIIFNFTGFSAGTLILIVVAVLVGWQYVRQYRSAMEHIVDVEEVRKLEAEFETRFGRPLSGLPQMKEMKKSMEEAYHGSKTIRTDLEDEKETFIRLRDETATRLHTLTGKSLSPNEWVGAIKKLNQLRDRMEKQLNQERLALAALNIAETDYHVQSPSVAYSQESLEASGHELDQVRANLKEKTDELANLKQRISEKTKDEITVDWETLIRNLQRKREEVASAYREITAKILAGILVNEQLDVIRTQEEEKIRKKLASPMVSRPIHDITGRYSGVSYDGGNLSVSDNYGQFALADLSTGAREQVLLGLRIGFAAHILRENHLFLMLDDAFQHADWQRRNRLLDQTITLAKEGWQIIYFTMDDHIRKLFDAAGQAHFPHQYRCYELNT